MSLENVATDLQVLTNWYNKRCDGRWEHEFGVTIESTDNPGWQITFTDLPLPSNQQSSEVVDKLLQQNVQVIRDGQNVRIFSPFLPRCLSAAAILIQLKEASSKVNPPTRGKKER